MTIAIQCVVNKRSKYKPAHFVGIVATHFCVYYSPLFVSVTTRTTPCFQAFFVHHSHIFPVVVFFKGKLEDKDSDKTCHP